MYYLVDINNYVGDFGNTETVNRFKELSNTLELKELKTFLDQGFHTKPKTLLKEINGVDFGFTELNEIAEEIKPVIKSAKEIVILTTDID